MRTLNVTANYTEKRDVIITFRSSLSVTLDGIIDKSAEENKQQE